MADAIRLDSAIIQDVVESSRSLWSSYISTTVDNILPAECFRLKNILHKVPAFPSSILTANNIPSSLQYHPSDLGLNISGTSTWQTSFGDCQIPYKEMQHKLVYGVLRSKTCSLSEKSRFSCWPDVQDENEQKELSNHLVVLFLAWAYILSARWKEMQSNRNFENPRFITRVRYSSPQAHHLKEEEKASTEAIIINIGGANQDASRWWSAILAPGEGWQATMQFQGKTYLSPWSAHMDQLSALKIRAIYPQSPRAATFSRTPSSDQALIYLTDYCKFHGILSQCIAALTAALFLPGHNVDGGDLVIHFLKPFQSHEPRTREFFASQSQSASDLQHEFSLLPYYMTLSCNIRGLRALLSGIFFDPTISCNCVSPWLQPAFEMIDDMIAREDFVGLTAMMTKRQPALGALWLGAIMVGTEKSVLQPLRVGLSLVELHAAAWTGTIHSFISIEPHISGCTDQLEISRSNECRLLFITGSENHSRPPICPWQPFGVTPLDMVDTEVRKHACCENHCLHYMNWRWDTTNGPSTEDQGYDRGHVTPQPVATCVEAHDLSKTCEASKLLQSEHLSAAATRSIFSWLRFDGYAPTEKDIFGHEWFDVGCSSGESASTENTTSSDNITPRAKRVSVEAWLDKVE